MMSLLRMIAQVTIKPDELNVPQPELKAGGSLHTILQIVFAIAGVVALIVIIVAGLRFVLSQGDPNNVAKARNTIIYAVVGLIVCILAFSIVTFVVGNL